MTHTRVRACSALLSAATLLPVAACSQPAKAGPEPVTPIGALPSRVAGYAVHPEDVRKQLEDAGRHAYVTGVKLWSLRERSYLRATVEVARFARDAPVGDERFRATVATQVATSNPVRRTVGDTVVYVTTGEREVYYVWFQGRDLLLVTVPATTPARRALLRGLLAAVRP